MKTLKKSFYFLFLFAVLAFTACSGDDDGNGDGGDGGSGGDEYVTAKVDGAAFTASTDPASLIGATKATANGTTILTVQGSTNSGDFINFTVVNYTGVATYTTGDSLSNPNLIQYGELTGSTANVWASNLATAAVGGLTAGEIKVTKEENGVVEGTFSFQGYNAGDQSTKNITEGTFKATLD